MARIVSFVVLLVILLVIFGVFFHVMASFLLPLFLAVLLVIVFGPVHRWMLERCKGHDRVAALLTTIVVLIVFFAPTSFILMQAAMEGESLYKTTVEELSKSHKLADEEKAKVEEKDKPVAGKQEKGKEPQRGLEWASKEIAKWAGKLGVKIDPAEIQEELPARMGKYLTPMAIGTGEFLLSFVFGFIIMILAVYYFFADGRAMTLAVMRLSPLDDKYEAQLIDQFVNVTRAVVLATLLSALAQGILAGIGFYFAGVEAVFLLTVITSLLAIIPFIGAAGVWVPVCLWLVFFKGEYWTAGILAAYCAVVVSNIDNVIKPYILQGRSNIHPLLALLSVIGGVNALGAIGIVVGPMAVVFLQTLLEMVNKEMAAMAKEKVITAEIKTK